MRRMYSEQELTNVINQVLNQKIESGEFDDVVAESVDAYLVEHPVDITALEGQDVELNSLDADGLITGAEIIEKMSGYAVAVNTDSSSNITPIYSGIVKTGNKVTIVLFAVINYTGVSGQNMFNVTLPSAIVNKLYPYTLGAYNDVLDVKEIPCYNALQSNVKIQAIIRKTGSGLRITGANLSNLADGEDYFMRIEETFLLSNNLTPNE